VRREIPHQCQTASARRGKKRCHVTARSKVSTFEKQCHLRCLRFCKKHGHGNILLINFVSDVRCKRLFHLHKPNLQPRWVAVYRSQAAELTSKSFGSLRRQIIDEAWIIRWFFPKSRRNTGFQFIRAPPQPLIGFLMHAARPFWERCGQRSYPPEP
jgi:hypothetical protein